MAHCVYPTEEEIIRLGKWHTGQSPIARAANSLYSRSTHPSGHFGTQGRGSGLGCDGSSSSDHMSLWLEARTALFLAKSRRGRGP